MENPFKLTTEEREMMKDDWKKPVKKKVQKRAKKEEEKERVNLHSRHTVASKQKQKISVELMEFL